MTRTRLWPLLAVIAIAALALPALSLAGRNTIEVNAKLKGKNEVPGPGSDKGKGDITVFLKPTKDKVCFELEVSKLDTIVAGHIHKGTEEEAGPIKVTLIDQEVEGTGNYEGCTANVKSKLIKKIADAPEKFYANIHTLDYPEGAIRGQLQGLVG
jgi:CHRD domain